MTRMRPAKMIAVAAETLKPNVDPPRRVEGLLAPLEGEEVFQPFL
jgi:hypothetical protein